MEDNQLLVESLLDALALQWTDNGNIMAEAVRDQCISTLAQVLAKTFEEVEAMVDRRVIENQ